MKPEIDRAIAKGVEYLLGEQRRDGSWGIHGDYIGGLGGLVVYTLLKTGVDADHPAMRRALAYLDSCDPDRTYSRATMMLAYGETDSDRDKSRIEGFLGGLLSSQKKDGDWGYPQRGPDLSNVQYAALGLWVAHKLDLDVPIDAWRDLLESVFKYQEPPALMDVTSKKAGGTGSGQLRVAGFRYTPGTKLASGSMTTAGISVLQICKIGLGRKLKRGQRRRIDDAIEAGMNWLDVHFRVNENPNRPGHKYYYLYGLERAGALTRREQIGDHWWYLEGARYLLKAQKPEGHWGGVKDTCFALLFLRRATKGRGPTTGASGHKSEHLFSAGTDRGGVSLRGAGQQPLALWVDSFGSGVKRRHEEYGIRVLQVEYFDHDRRLAVIPGDPTKTWDGDAFLHREAALSRGIHEISVRVTLLAEDAPPGQSEPVEVIDSREMEVHIRDVFEPWMDSVARLKRFNLLKQSEDLKFTATASSNPDHAKQAFDLKDGTHWACAPDDSEPTISLEIEGVVKARRVLFTQAATKQSEVGAKFDMITEVELRLNKDKNGYRVKLNPDPLALTEFELPKNRRVRRISVKVIGSEGDTGRVGFAEIALAARDRGQRKRSRK